MLPPPAVPPVAPPVTAPGTGLPYRPPRMGDAFLVGTAAAGIGGLLWWAAATVTQFEYWQALSFLMGAVIGFGVLVGARRGGAGPAILAFVLAVVAVPVVVYFIDRTFLIDALADDGQLRTVPLWVDVEAFVDATRGWIDFEPTRAVGWVLGPVVAAIVAGIGRR